MRVGGRDLRRWDQVTGQLERSVEHTVEMSDWKRGRGKRGVEGGRQAEGSRKVVSYFGNYLLILAGSTLCAPV